MACFDEERGDVDLQQGKFLIKLKKCTLFQEKAENLSCLRSFFCFAFSLRYRDLVLQPFQVQDDSASRIRNLEWMFCLYEHKFMMVVVGLLLMGFATSFEDTLDPRLEVQKKIPIFTMTYCLYNLGNSYINSHYIFLLRPMPRCFSFSKAILQTGMECLE